MKNPRSEQIRPANIEWEDGTPCSEDFDDIYFSKQNGLEESEYVFLQRNSLNERWNKQQTKPFTVVETGFGTGLNFLSAWRLWRNAGCQGVLSFISIEKHPLEKGDLRKSLECWPELRELSNALCEQYPPLVNGMHLCQFDQGKVQLHLLFGDVNRDLSNYAFTADAWFLDGFAPSKNSAMWSDHLFSLMGERSKKGTTFATFTAAGFVKRGLKANGFHVSKSKGYGRKREMLNGVFSENYRNEDFNAYHPEALPVWSRSDTLFHNSTDISIPADKPTTDSSQNKATNFDVLVIGSGLAGLTTAHELASHQLRVAILEQNEAATSEASGQKQLALYAKLPAIENKEFRFILAGMLYSQRYFQKLQSNHPEHKFWNKTGLLQLSWNDKELERRLKLFSNNTFPREVFESVDAERASSICGINTAHPGIWSSNSGWLDPSIFSKAILSHTNIELLSPFKADKLEYERATELWKVGNEQHLLSASAVVVCGSNQSKLFKGMEFLPTKPIRGQVTSIYAPDLPKAKSVICGEGYLCPPQDNTHHFGATYDLDNNNAEILIADNQRNLDNLNKWLPNWIQSGAIREEQIIGNAGVRCTTPDYTPIVGQVPELQQLINCYAGLRHDAKTKLTGAPKLMKHVYVNTGHGSKGLVTTPISAQLISSLIMGTPTAMSAEQIQMLSPSRFPIKSLIQGKL